MPRLTKEDKELILRYKLNNKGAGYGEIQKYLCDMRADPKYTSRQAVGNFMKRTETKNIIETVEHNATANLVNEEFNKHVKNKDKDSVILAPKQRKPKKNKVDAKYYKDIDHVELTKELSKNNKDILEIKNKTNELIIEALKNIQNSGEPENYIAVLSAISNSIKSNEIREMGHIYRNKQHSDKMIIERERNDMLKAKLLKENNDPATDLLEIVYVNDNGDKDDR